MNTNDFSNLSAESDISKLAQISFEEIGDEDARLWECQAKFAGKTGKGFSRDNNAAQTQAMADLKKKLSK